MCFISVYSSFYVVLLLVFSDRSLFAFLYLPANRVRSSSAVFSMFHHPNIAVTYGVTESTGSDMLVIEKVLTPLSYLLADSKANDEVNVRERESIFLMALSVQ